MELTLSETQLQELINKSKNTLVIAPYKFLIHNALTIPAGDLYRIYLMPGAELVQLCPSLIANKNDYLSITGGTIKIAAPNARLATTTSAGTILIDDMAMINAGPDYLTNISTSEKIWHLTA